MFLLILPITRQHWCCSCFFFVFFKALHLCVNVDNKEAGIILYDDIDKNDKQVRYCIFVIRFF